MKKIIYLYILIFLSCDPGWFGLKEDLGIYSYHDGLALAWESFFSEEDTEVAIAYVKSVISETEDVVYHNSAYTALGWLYMFKSNAFIGEYPDSITAYREAAFEEFSYDEDELLAIAAYEPGCYYDFCCSDCFVEDRKLGLLYTEIEAFFILSNEQQDMIVAEDPTYLQDLIDGLATFVTDNDGLPPDQDPPEVEYDFMNGKPIGNNGETMDFSIDDVKIYLAHIYFRNGDFTESCDELTNLNNSNYCDLNCKLIETIGWNNTNLDDLLDCLNSLNSQTLF